MTLPWYFLYFYHRALGLDASYDVCEDGDGDGEQNCSSSPFTRLVDGESPSCTLCLMYDSVSIRKDFDQTQHPFDCMTNTKSHQCVLVIITRSSLIFSVLEILLVCWLLLMNIRSEWFQHSVVSNFFLSSVHYHK